MSKYWFAKPLGMFAGEDQTENFRSLSTIVPCRVVRRAPEPHRLLDGDPLTLPGSYVYEGHVRSTAEFLGSTETAAMLIIQRGRVRYEGYWLGAERTTQWATFSITKSWLSALAGIAVGEGAISSIDDPVTRYVPELEKSAFDGVSIKHVLQMASGARWNESYHDAESDIRESGRAVAAGGSRTAVAMSLRREFEPGTYHRYSSIDSHVLGLVLRHATRTSLAAYLEQKLWWPLGAESDAFWCVEGDGFEWASGGLSATLRDTAKLGLLYSQRGVWNDRQLIPQAWVQASITPDAPHLRPGPCEQSASPFGYGYQFWIPDDSGEFCAMGVYNQFVYVDPAAELVIAKFSANRDYGSSASLDSFREPEHFALFRAIAERA